VLSELQTDNTLIAAHTHFELRFLCGSINHDSEVFMTSKHSIKPP